VTDSDDLYGLPLERFVSERNALAKTLRKEGDREGAQEVAALRKPSLAAWAVNQLVRTRAGNVQALFEAGDALRRAQSELLEGRGDGGELRATVASERDQVGELTDLARGLLSSDGHELTQAMVDRVSETLHAAALDDDARTKVKDGRLERELRHVGIGGLAAGTLAPAPPAKRTRAAPESPRRAGGRDAERAERERAAQAERERAEQLKAARRAEAEARRRAERAQRELRTTQTRRDRAADALRQADDALAEAQERADAAVTDHERAQQVLDEI
jgi:hypothetical protein